MKKVFLLTAMIILTLSMSAQDRNQTLGKNASNVTFTGTAGDTITNTDTWSYQWNMASKDDLQGYYLLVQLDSVSGTPQDACVLAGSADNSTFTTISTVTWYGTTSDTTFTYSDVSTGVLYRYLRLAITGTGTQKASVNKIHGKIGGL